MAVPAMVKNPYAGMVKNRPQGGGYSSSYIYKLPSIVSRAYSAPRFTLGLAGAFFDFFFLVGANLYFGLE